MAISYSNFSSTSGLKLNGNASQAGDALRLTPDAKAQLGSAFLDTPFAIGGSTSFSTNFQLRITGSQGTNGADGMTFMLQNSSRGAAAIGDSAGQLGYGAGQNNPAIDKSLAIKFDTWANSGESSNNFVGVNLNGVAIGSVAGAKAPIDLNSGSLVNVWVDYNGTTDNLAVYLSGSTSKPTTALINYTVDLASIVGTQAYAGFSAATGGAPNIHDVLKWQLDTSTPTTSTPTTSTPTTSPAPTPPPTGSTIDYRDFANTSGLKLNGNAAQTGNVLQLTPDITQQAGSAFWTAPIGLNSDTSFSTNFQFRIRGAQGTNGTDGMTFMLQNSSAGINALGGIAGQLGYGAGSGTAINKSLAIKFDTWANPGESSNNFVGVNLNGVAIGSVAGANAPFDINSGGVANVWVDYNGTTNNLAVYVSNGTTKPTGALINYTVDLSSLLGNQAYVGFSAATGGAANIHEVLNWQFSASNPTAPPIEPPPPPSSGYTTSINYNDFSSASGIKLNGAAAQNENVLRLTPEVNGVAGSAFATDRIALYGDTSFQTSFQLKLSGSRGTNGADGITFMLQNSSAGLNALGGTGGSLGLSGINNSLAIKFDTWQNAGELSNNYVGVVRDGKMSEPIAQANAPFDLNGSNTILNAWVDYNGVTDNLKVYLSNQSTKPTTALINTTVRLSNVVGSEAFVGFSAGTGGAPNLQDVLSWQMTTSTPPPPAVQPGIARILPLGDSITLGVTSRTADKNRTDIPGGYRRVLWNKFTDAGLSVDFVGSETDGSASGWNGTGDRNHQGSGGWTIDKVSANVMNYLNRENPDIVTLTIGTNNFIKDTADQMISKLSTLIDQITGFSPKLKLLVASIPPIHLNTDENATLAQQQQQVQTVTDYNNAMPGLIANKQAQGKNVDFVDMRSLTVNDLAPRNDDSGVHPSMTGYDKIGNLWYTALLDKVGISGNTLSVG